MPRFLPPPEQLLSKLLGLYLPGLSASFILFEILRWGFELEDVRIVNIVGLVAGLLIPVLSSWATVLEWKLARRYHQVALPFPYDLVIMVVLILTPVVEAFHAVSMLLAIQKIARFLRTRPWWVSWISRMRHRPAGLVSLSFLFVILLGTFLFMLPASTVDFHGLGLVDALFTSTSATCVTGLSVVGTAGPVPELPVLSLFGKAVLLILIQTGGLGIMTISTALLALVGKRLAWDSQEIMGSLMDEDDVKAIRGGVLFIFQMTLIAEAVGAVILSWRFSTRFADTGRAVFHGIFHSVSAFCNAGFSLNADSLTSYNDDPFVLGTVAALIVVGGLGFTVVGVVVGLGRSGLVRFIGRWGRPLTRLPWIGWRLLDGLRGGRRHPLLIHARMALLTSGLLLLFGALWFLLFERSHSLAGLTPFQQVMGAFFQSVTLRTAGFNTVDMAALSGGTYLVVLMMMFIGGCPGGTAGGVKTTTMAVLVLGMAATLRGRERVTMWDRTLNQKTLLRAASILMVSLAILLVLTILLVLVDGELGLGRVVFEAVSAFGTVGLSQGITTSLSAPGRVVVVVMMFVGRLGPMTMALVFSEGARDLRKGRISYPEGKVLVG